MTAVIEPMDPGRVDQTLEAVHRHATRLLTQAPGLPRRVRVRAGDVSVELEWPVVESGQATTATTVAAPVAAPVASGPLATEETVSEQVSQIRAPMVGVFYRAPEPGAKPFVSEGDLVEPGQQVGIVEAMKLMVPIEADQHGRIVEILVANGESVEYDQPLFTVAPLEVE